MRGQQAIFNDFITPTEITPKAENIGRNKRLINQRDQRLLYRYYFYIQIIRKQYGDTLSILSQQFDLSELRIIVCISDNNSILKKIMHEEKPGIKDLRQKYPWMVWDQSGVN